MRTLVVPFEDSGQAARQHSVIYNRIGPPKNLVGLAVLALQIARVDWRLPYPLGQCLLARAYARRAHKP